MAEQSDRLGQERHDKAALEIVEIASRFPADEAIGVLAIAHARLVILDSISSRIEKREKERFQDGL